MADDVQGIGFTTADNIARSLGWAADDPHRLEAGLYSVLNGIALDGHVCIPREELLNSAARFLGVRRELMADVLRELAANGDVPGKLSETWNTIIPLSCTKRRRRRPNG